MSTSNFQWRHDGLRWRIKLMQNTPTASLFYCGARDGHDTFIFPKNLLTLLMEQSWHPESVTVSRKRMELAAVKEYLDEHYTEKLTLDDLAEKFFINKFYLSKIFKETYGTTVNNYLISKRITRAKQLLRFTDMTVDEVGAAVGMGDANYFSRMFRKVEGISPREYRKQW